VTNQLGLMGIVEGIGTKTQGNILSDPRWRLGQGFLSPAPNAFGSPER